MTDNSTRRSEIEIRAADLRSRERHLEAELKKVRSERERIDVILTCGDFDEFEEPPLPDARTKLGQMLVLLASSPDKSWRMVDILEALDEGRWLKTRDKVRKRLIELAAQSLIEHSRGGYYQIRASTITRMATNGYPE